MSDNILSLSRSKFFDSNRRIKDVNSESIEKITEDKKTTAAVENKKPKKIFRKDIVSIDQIANLPEVFAIGVFEYTKETCKTKSFRNNSKIKISEEILLNFCRIWILLSSDLSPDKINASFKEISFVIKEEGNYIIGAAIRKGSDITKNLSVQVKFMIQNGNF